MRKFLHSVVSWVYAFSPVLSYHQLKLRYNYEKI